MSLHVGDPRSRGRSKSPSGHIRERSKSRDPRLPTGQDTHRYLASEFADGKRHSRSRSRGASPGGPRPPSSRYGPTGPEFQSDGRTPHLRVEQGRDYYYQSDSGDSKGPRRDNKQYPSSPHRRSVHYDSYSDPSYSDSDEDGLAYGDLPEGPERSFYGFTGTSRTQSAGRDGAMMSGALNGDASYSNKPSRPTGPPKEEPTGSHPSYARPEPFQYTHVQPGSSQYSGHPASSTVQSNWAPIPECEQPGFVPPTSQGQSQTMPGAFPLPTTSHPDVPATTAAAAFSSTRYVAPEGLQRPYVSWNSRPLSMPGSNAYTPVTSTHQRTASTDAAVKTPYAAPSQYQYAHIDPNFKFTSKSTGESPAKPLSYSAAPQYSTKTGASQVKEPQYVEIKHSANPQFSKFSPAHADSGPQYVEITPGNRATGRPHSHSVSSANNLSVTRPDPTHRPASPMLEPYKGTYQTISPMPSPIVVVPKLDEDISDMEPLGDESDGGLREHRRKKSRDGKDRKGLTTDRVKRESSRVRYEQHGSTGSESLVVISPSSSRKRVSFYDAGQDAMALQEALSHTMNTDNKALIRILPHLTGEEVLELRKEYKKHVKLHGKGVNIAKHIRLKLGNGAFGKVCYATALGRWESEAFWANCYYQSSTSRRELLIESLFGRTNREIREIKECFRDSRYQNSLEKCMKAELKADKFRIAVLIALEERRQSERDIIDMNLVDHDVEELHRALITPHGGETAMICIIVRRSDSHLREVLRAYEKMYGHNFAKAMIGKSQNLVGETLAHILNGAINRPMRDALLLHQALRESRTGKERSELLISRLVRLHWEPRHLERVKSDFRRRYGQRLEDAIAEEVLTSSGGSEWGEFCIELARGSKALASRS